MWGRGHTNIKGNEMKDELAQQAAAFHWTSILPTSRQYLDKQ